MSLSSGKLLAQTMISEPVGKGILPGAGNEGTDIQSSILFAKIIPFLIDWTINLAMGLAVIAIIAGGYMYLTSYGDDERKQRATRTLTYALIGLAIALTAYGIVAIVTSIRLS
jgi:hypothetical protein